jgi:general L-amino acid transport system permease protein
MVSIRHLKSRSVKLSDLSYVRIKEIPQSAPPIGETGLIKWTRENLFSNWLNSILTLVALYFISNVLINILPWLFGGNWGASSLRQCRDETGSAACFAVLAVRWKQLIFGFYPSEEYWRPVITFFLMILALVPVLFSKFFKFLWVSIFYPGIAVWLLWGGSFWPTFSFYFGLFSSIYLYSILGQKFKFSMSKSLLGSLCFFIAFNIFLSGPVHLALESIVNIRLPPVESSQFGGFLLSVLLGVTSISVCFPIGILLALGRQSNLPLVTMICVGFIEFVRGVPLITLLFVASVLLNYFLPPGTSFDLILRVLIMLTLFSAAYQAEVIRGGIAALPVGQYEAANSMGLTYWQSQRLIIMPQALKVSIPGTTNNFIAIFKDTTLVSIIGLLDPVGMASAIRADQTWNGIYWELFVAIGSLYFIFCFGMSRYSLYLERQLQTDLN